MFTNLTKFAKSIKNGTIDAFNTALENFRENDQAVNTIAVVKDTMRNFVNNNFRDYQQGQGATQVEAAMPANMTPNKFFDYNYKNRDVASVAARDTYEKMREYDEKQTWRKQPEWKDLDVSEKNKYKKILEDIHHNDHSLLHNNPELSKEENDRNYHLYSSSKKAIKDYYYKDRYNERNYNILRDRTPHNTDAQTIQIASQAAYENLRQYDKKHTGQETLPWDQLSDSGRNDVINIVKGYDNQQEPLQIDSMYHYPESGNTRERLLAFRSMALHSLEVAKTGDYEHTVKEVGHFFENKSIAENKLENAAHATYDVMRELDKELYKTDKGPWEKLGAHEQEKWMGRVDDIVHGSGPNMNELGTGPQVIGRAVGQDVSSFEESREYHRMKNLKEVAQRAMMDSSVGDYKGIPSSVERYKDDYMKHDMERYGLDNAVSDYKKEEAAQKANMERRNERAEQQRIWKEQEPQRYADNVAKARRIFGSAKRDVSETKPDAPQMKSSTPEFGF